MSQQLLAERMRVTVLSSPLESNETVPMSFGSLADRRACLVEVEAGDLVGVGESWINYPAWAPRERLATLCDGTAPLVLGRDVSDPLAINGDLIKRLVPVGRQWGAPGPIWQALSGLDLALWDLLGKRTGYSVAQLLTSSTPRTQIPAYASGVGPTQVRSLCKSALEAGLTAVKTKIGFGAEQDLATLQAARSTVGDRARLFADANQAWGLADAIEMSGMLDQHGIEWVEEPLASDELDELEKFGAETAIRIATGENLYGLSTFERYIDSSAVHTIQPDLTKAGGLSLGAPIAERAHRTGTSVAPHCYGGALGIVASLHLGAAYGSVEWVELDVRDNPLRTDLLATPLRLEQGALVVPDGPGLGVVVDPDAISHYRIHTEERSSHDL